MLFRKSLLWVLGSVFALALFVGCSDSVTTVSTEGAEFIDPRFDLPPAGMAKPVADLRDYNGTYTGAPGTGTMGYSTLYRDNYDDGDFSGCNGEGCGRHPGVDIPVDTGTSVHAAKDGRVVKATCVGTGGWGGLVIIKSANPWVGGDSVYFSYAHLKRISVTENGPPVITGQIVGYSGGVQDEPCSGNSTAPHVHFQVDKSSPTHTIPYWPSGDIDVPDYNYDVMTYTYNPMPFIWAGWRWTFWENGFAEYWTPSGVSAWGVTGGALWIDGTSDPFIRRGENNVACGRSNPCSSRITAEASIYNKVGLDIAFGCRDDPLKVYFITKDSTTWSETRSVSVNPPAGGGQFHVNMGGNTQWSGIVTGLRIDPAESCSSGSGDIINFGHITIERSNH